MSLSRAGAWIWRSSSAISAPRPGPPGEAGMVRTSARFSKDDGVHHLCARAPGRAMTMTAVGGALTWGHPRARWVLAATVLGSALTFIDATVVNIALPTIGADLDAGTSALTWVVNAYALTLAAFVLLGGSVGDR